MTVLTQKELRDQFKVTQKDIDSYFKGHPKLPRTKVVISRVTERIRASKIAKEPGKQVSVKQSAGAWQIIYGKGYRIGGTLSFINGTAVTNGAVHLVYTIAGHQITSVDDLFLDNESVVFGASPDPRWSRTVQRLDGTQAPADNQIFMSPTIGGVGQATNPDLNGQLPTLWTSLHTQDNCAYVYLILRSNAALFPDGIPEVTFNVTGKPVINPYTGVVDATAVSNTADIIADFLMDTKYGLGVPMGSIDLPLWKEAHDICNENVTLANGSTEKRYTFDGAFEVSQTPQETLEAMAASMGGTVTFVNGLWKIYPAKYRTPSITLTETDILSEIRVQTKLSRRDSFNGVRGTFPDPNKKHEESDFPPVKNDFYKTLDNNERIWEDIQLPYTISAARCQRLAKIELERNRQAITVQLTATLKAYQVEPPETLMLSIARFGWVSKVFEVQDSSLVFLTGDGSETPAIAVQLLLRETASGVFDFAAGSETSTDLAPNTMLPNPLSVAALSGLALSSGTSDLYVRADGTVFSRIKVSWTSVADFFVSSGGQVEIQYKKSSDSNWQSAAAVPGDLNFSYILDVQDYSTINPVTYDVRARAVNALRVPGDWTTISNYRVVGKSAKPSNVTGFAGAIGSFGIRFSWDKVPDLDVNLYEIRVGPIGSNWDTADIVSTVGGTTYFANIQNAGSYQFFIKAKDTSGNYSLEASTNLTIIPGPSAPNTTTQFLQTDLLFRWTESTSNFAIAQYEIYFGAITDTNPTPTFSNAILLASVKGTTYVTKVTWVGTRIFWVVARDVAGNLGSPFQLSITITAPGIPNNLTGEVIDNNVLLRWSPSSLGTLPIDKYRVYKGDIFGSAQLVGEVGGTFAAVFESVGSGSSGFTYWVIAIDSAGNTSLPASVNLKVSEPPDFILRTDGAADPRDALIATNVFIEDFGFLATQGGPGGVGSPMGLLAAITVSGTVAGGGGPGATTGQPIGVLLAVTKN